jgi:hypothetical protein
MFYWKIEGTLEAMMNRLKRPFSKTCGCSELQLSATTALGSI